MSNMYNTCTQQRGTQKAHGSAKNHSQNVSLLKKKKKKITVTVRITVTVTVQYIDSKKGNYSNC